MTNTSLFRGIARVGVGVVLAGMIIGQATTALAETGPSSDVATASKTGESWDSGDYSDYSEDYSEDYDYSEYDYSEYGHSGDTDYSDTSDEVDVVAPALFLDGTVSGRVELTTVSCDLLFGTSWTWQALGTIDGIPADITFTTNFYRGPGDYNPTTITDEQGGQATAEVGDVQVATNGATDGVFTVDAGEQSGYIDAILDNGPNGQSIRVSGTWQCFAQ